MNIFDNRNKLSVKQRLLALLALICLVLASFWAAQFFEQVPFPSHEKPIRLYSNQTRDDLKQIYQKAISSANESIILMIYSLTDPSIIAALKDKADTGVDVIVVCDGKASPGISRKLGGKVKLHRMYHKGLMHQKILSIDDTRSWIGSANMTSDSLKMHGNLVIGIYSDTIAQAIRKRANSMIHQSPSISYEKYHIGGQDVELSFLPDDRHSVEKIIQLIRSAQKCVKVAMFTFTRNDFAQEIIQASKRGADTEVVIDRNSGKGVGRKVVEMLKKEGINVRLSQGPALLHHKLLIIDDSILVTGSANWTQSAFNKNHDCYLVISPLEKDHIKHLRKLWTVISMEAFH